MPSAKYGELQSKFEQLRGKLVGADAVDLEQVNTWEREVKIALLKDDLQNHDGIRLILEHFVVETEEINKQLLENEELGSEDRKLLFTRKRWCEQFVRLFTVARSTIDSVEKSLDDNL